MNLNVGSVEYVGVMYVCVWSALCVYLRKILRLRLEILDEVEELRGKLFLYIFCVYFGFRLIFYFSMGRGNG